MSCVCIIPARGGSQRIPRKNIKLFHGKPIIAYSIETAQKAGIFNRIIVSTDDDEIAAVAKKYGAEVMMRSLEMARNEVGTQEVMRYVLSSLPEYYQTACCLYPCAPMLDANTLERGYRMIGDMQTPYIVPVATWLRDPGQFYFGKTPVFMFGVALNTNMTRIIWIDPETECDINTPEDWAIAEEMYVRLHGGENAN